MIKQIELPQVGESVTEGVIGKWLAQPGQRIEQYDPLVEVVTDKVSMEVPSPYAGVFVRALAEEGLTVPMGQPICEIDVAGDESPATTDETPPAPHTGEPEATDAGRVGGAWAMPAAHAAETPETGEGEEPGQAFEFMDRVRSVGPTGSGEGGQGRPDALQDAASAGEEREDAALSVAAPDRRHVVSPLVARLSSQYGIDLSTLEGTGAGGRVTSKDLLEAVNRLTAQTSPEAAPPPEAPVGVSDPSVLDAPASDSAEEALPSLAATEEAAEAEATPSLLEAVDEAPTAGVASPSEPVALDDAGEDDPDAAWADATAAGEEPEQAEFGRDAGWADDAVAGEESGQAEFARDAGWVDDAVAGEESEQAEFARDAVWADDAVAGEESEQAEFGRDVVWADDAVAGEESEQAEFALAEDAETSEMPLTPVRRIIAEHMARSAREIPAAWTMVEADVTGLVRARERLRAAFGQEHGVPLTFLPFAASAAAAALREHPRLNARWDDGRITLNHRVNIAIAVATEAGLMVPVVRDADTLSIADLAAVLRRLTDAARRGTLRIEDVQGGTFTLNNTGALGSVASVPIINHPQAAILTTEAVVKRPVVVAGDAIAVRSMMNLCLTFDHRVCDGADAAAFLGAVKARLEAMDERMELG